MATKAAHTQFNREVSKYLLSIGAEIIIKDPFAMAWMLKTIAGNLRLCVHEPERSEVFSLYCRFQDVEKAKQVIPNGFLNQFNGKWNFHEYDANNLLADFKEQIAPLLIKTLTT